MLFKTLSRNPRRLKYIGHLFLHSLEFFSFIDVEEKRCSFLHRFVFLILLTSSTFCATFEKELAVCAIFQNDAKYLTEWIDFHLEQGVEHFYLYDNLSNDHPLAILNPYIEKGVITYKSWPHTYTGPDEWARIQCAAYMDCVKDIKNKIKWCAFIDTDEFLYSPIGYSQIH